MLANVALPAFFPHSLATLVGIFVIAAIEGWFLMRGLKLRYSESYRLGLAANWMSTIAGIPLAWLLWVAGLIPVTMGLSVIGINSHPAVALTLMQTEMTGGMVPNEWTNVGSAGAWIVLLIPFWFGSVWIERRTIMKRLPNHERSEVSRAVVRGNLATYAIFLIFGVVALSSALADLPNQKARYQEFRELRERMKQQQGEQARLPKPTPRGEFSCVSASIALQSCS